MIFTFGVLLMADPLSLRLLFVPLLWSLIGGSAAFLLRVPQDWMLLLSGAMLLLDRRHRGRSEYEAVFGPLPDLGTLPSHAGPVADPAVAAAWEALPEERREAVNAVFANIGKAIAAYERTILPPETRFDRWIAAENFPARGLLSEGEIAGLRLFLGKGECINCHNGPLLTDNHFHNTGVAAVPEMPDDLGRAAGVRLVQEDPFNCLGPYSDADSEQCAELRFLADGNEEMLRAFKPPSLRGAASRPPYMHAGQIGTLDEVLAHYATAPESLQGHSELRPKDLTATERAQIIAFLASLDPVAPDTDQVAAALSRADGAQDLFFGLKRAGMGSFNSRAGCSSTPS